MRELARSLAEAITAIVTFMPTIEIGGSPARRYAGRKKGESFKQKARAQAKINARRRRRR